MCTTLFWNNLHQVCWKSCTMSGKWSTMYMCVKGINVGSVTTIYLIDFRTVLMEWFFIWLQDRLKILKIRYSKNYQWVRLSHLGSGTSGKCHLAMDFTTEFKFCIKKVGISSCHSNIYFIGMVIFNFDVMYQNLSVVSSNLDQGEVYNIVWSRLSVTCDRSVVFSGSYCFLHQ